MAQQAAGSSKSGRVAEKPDLRSLQRISLGGIQKSCYIRFGRGKPRVNRKSNNRYEMENDGRKFETLCAGYGTRPDFFI